MSQTSPGAAASGSGAAERLSVSYLSVFPSVGDVLFAVRPAMSG